MDNLRFKTKNSFEDSNQNFGNQFTSIVNPLNGANMEINNLKSHLKRQVDCVIDLDKTYLEKRRQCLHDKISEFNKEDFDKFPEFVHPNSNQLMKLYDINFLTTNQAPIVPTSSTNQSATNHIGQTIDQATNQPKSSILESTDPADFSSLIELRTNILNSLINNINTLANDHSELNNVNSLNNLNSLNNSNDSGNFQLTDAHFSAFNSLDSFNNPQQYNDLNGLNFSMETPQIKMKAKRGRSKLSPGSKDERKPRSKNKFLKAINLVTNKNSLIDHSNPNLANTNPLNLSAKTIEKSNLRSDSSACRKVNYDYQTRTINDVVDHIPLDNVDEDGFLIYDKLVVKKEPAVFFNHGKRILCPNCPYVSTTNFVYHSTCHKLNYDTEKEVQCNYCNWTVQKSRNFTTLMSKHFTKHFVGFLIVDQGLDTKNLSEEIKTKKWFADLIALQSKLVKPMDSSSNSDSPFNPINTLTAELDTYLNSYTEKNAREKSKIDLTNDGLLNETLNDDKSNNDLEKSVDVNQLKKEFISMFGDNDVEEKDSNNNDKKDDLEEDKDLATNKMKKNDLSAYHGLEVYQNLESNAQDNVLNQVTTSKSIDEDDKRHAKIVPDADKSMPLICIDSDEDDPYNIFGI